jgi:hypothetical protein
VIVVVLPANAVVDDVPNASSGVLPANAVEDDVPNVIPTLAVFAATAVFAETNVSV